VLIELPTIWLIVVNVLAWLVIHLGVAWAGTQLRAERFSPQSWICRARRWEGGGRFYEKVFGVKLWKDRLPDGAALFRGGFRKKQLNARDPQYLARFVRETCRGEIVHWVVLSAAPVFFLWNPPWAGAVMIFYAVIANLPCILAQRYNRLRLTRLMEKRSGGLLPAEKSEGKR
jgi:glycosyl-4,4'-diaponeurosporenoate acyltransferase